MRTIPALITVGALLLAAWMLSIWSTPPSFSDIEEGFEETSIRDILVGFDSKYSLLELQQWERPPGPPRVGVQVGHWQVEDAPEELDGLKRNAGGAVYGSLVERDVVYDIAELVVEDLSARGIDAELLPVTVPPGYIADVFVSIHADGSSSASVRGFKISAPHPRRDLSGGGGALSQLLHNAYEEATGLPVDPNITWRMRGYYAFNWERYDHAIHPMTAAAIVETGFLTNVSDRAAIVDAPSRAATGITEGIIDFLEYAEVYNPDSNDSEA